MQSNTTCYLALGSNLGNPAHNLKQAIKHINHLNDTQYVQSAPWYSSPAWGVTDQADFLNTVIEIKTRLTPMQLLRAIKIIEYRVMGRVPNARWHARLIDIDVLLYGQQPVQRQALHIPHALLHERCFVLVPLLQLKPRLPASLMQASRQYLKNHDCHEQLKQVKTPRLRWFC